MLIDHGEAMAERALAWIGEQSVAWSEGLADAGVSPLRDWRAIVDREQRARREAASLKRASSGAHSGREGEGEEEASLASGAGAHAAGSEGLEEVFRTLSQENSDGATAQRFATGPGGAAHSPNPHPGRAGATGGSGEDAVRRVPPSPISVFRGTTAEVSQAAEYQRGAIGPAARRLRLNGARWGDQGWEIPSRAHPSPYSGAMRTTAAQTADSVVRYGQAMDGEGEDQGGDGGRGGEEDVDAILAEALMEEEEVEEEGMRRRGWKKMRLTGTDPGECPKRPLLRLLRQVQCINAVARRGREQCQRPQQATARGATHGLREWRERQREELMPPLWRWRRG